MESVPVRCCKGGKYEGSLMGERFYCNDTFNDRCHCEQRHMHLEFPLTCLSMLSGVLGMGNFSE